MKHTLAEVRQFVVEAMYKTLGEKGTALRITEKTNPLDELGLESIDGLVFACILSEKLDWQIASKINPFVDDQRRRARRVGEIAKFIHELMLECEATNVRS